MANSSNFNSRDSNIHKIDLGMAWKELTGKPFVFALWAVSKEWLRGSPENFQYLAAEFERSKKEGFIARKQLEYVEKASSQLGLPVEIIQAYYNNIKYDLNQDKLEGLKYFETYLKDMNLL
jgi:chorismate dehydratase